MGIPCPPGNGTERNRLARLVSGYGLVDLAPTKDEARQRLQKEAERRRQAGDDPFADIYRKHLHQAISGVYAMDNALYREVARKSGYDQNVLQQVFEEAERRRARDETYTTADYLRDQSGKG